MNFSHCVALRIRIVNCEWDTIVQGDVSCTEELEAALGRHCVHIFSINVIREQ